MIKLIVSRNSVLVTQNYSLSVSHKTKTKTRTDDGTCKFRLGLFPLCVFVLYSVEGRAHRISHNTLSDCLLSSEPGCMEPTGCLVLLLLWSLSYGHHSSDFALWGPNKSPIQHIRQAFWVYWTTLTWNESVTVKAWWYPCDGSVLTAYAVKFWDTAGSTVSSTTTLCDSEVLGALGFSFEIGSKA